VINITKENSDIYDITGELTEILGSITRQVWVEYDKIGTICNHYRKEKIHGT